MFTALAYSDGTIRKLVSLDEVGAVMANRRELLWLDLQNPDKEEIAALEREFKFHRLAIEDVLRGRQRSKLDTYEGYFFIVLYSVSFKRSGHRRASSLRSEEVHIFVGRNFVVTVHQHAAREIGEAMRRWEENSSAVTTRGVGFLLYTICDSIVDNYFPVADAFGEAVDALEEKVFSAHSRNAVGEVFALRKDLLGLRRIVGPERDVINEVMRIEAPFLGEEKNAVYFADVYDHLIRVADTIDIYHDLLAGVLEGYLSMISNNLNETMRLLTAASIILMSLSVIAGIYGMNFRNMPELEWPLGYVWALSLMGAVGLILYMMFRRRGWL